MTYLSRHRLTVPYVQLIESPMYCTYIFISIIWLAVVMVNSSKCDRVPIQIYIINYTNFYTPKKFNGPLLKLNFIVVPNGIFPDLFIKKLG